MGISNPSGGTPAATVVGPDTFGAAAAVGASSAYARADHDHGLPAAPAVPAVATTVVGPDTFGAAAAVGASSAYARADHDHGLPAAPAVPAVATTVVGPDAFGAAAAVGASTAYARADHDHGLPAAPAVSLTNNGAHITVDAAIAAATATAVITTASLAVGTWLLSGQAEIVNGGATAGDCQLYVAFGTALGSINGPTAADGELPALTGGATQLTLNTLVSITTAGTMVIGVYSAVAGTAKATATAGGGGYPTGYTAIKIA